MQALQIHECYLINGKEIDGVYIRFYRDVVDNTYFVGHYIQPSGKCIKLKSYKTFNGASKYFNSL